ncbi:MAG: tetratricopeptide repeat protein [Waterburya sp.]
MVNNKLLELARNKDYQEVINNHQQYPIETVTEVADFLREEDVYNVALSLYHYLLKQHEASDYHFGIGQCYGKMYNYSLALWHLDRAFSLQPTRLGANYYAYILERNLQMKLANQWYKEAINNGYEQDLWTLSHYAYFLEKYDQASLAESYYQKVLNLNPAYTWAIKRYALFLLNTGREQESEQLMQTALLQFPENPFVKLNYLEYLIIRRLDTEYEQYLASLDYDHAPFPFQVLVDLLDYFQRYLLLGKSDAQTVQAYEQKASQLQDSIHRDFDDLNKVLLCEITGRSTFGGFLQTTPTQNGDLTEWQRLTKLLLL